MTTTDQLPSEPRTRRPWPKVWPEFLGRWPRLTGRQQPLLEVWHEGDESEGDRTAKFGVRIGLRCMPWEWMIVRAIMSQLKPDKWGIRLWTHRVVVILSTRQQGKTLILILVILRRLFKHRRRVVYTAQQWTTVEDVFDRVVAVIERVPSLKLRVERVSKKDNRGVIVLRPMAGDKHVVKADFGPRSQHFARGFTEVDDLILDEAYDLVPKETANLTGAQAASDNPQTIYASTAPVIAEHPNCGRLAGFYRQGLAGVAASFYFVLYAAPPRLKRNDPAAYPLAQPSYGVVGNDREMDAYLQGAKTSADLALFDADWLGWGDYPPPESVIISEIPAELWTTMRAEHAPKLTGSPAVGLHFDAGAGIWILTAAWYTDQGLAHLETGYMQSATSAQVVTAVVDLVTAWDPVAIAVKARSDTAAIKAELVKAGVEPVMVDGATWSQWCGAFLNAAVAAKFSHRGQRTLDEAAGSAVRKDLAGGGFVWDEGVGAGSAALVNATLAYGALATFAQPKQPPGLPLTDSGDDTAEVGGEARFNDEFDALTAVF